VETPTWLGLFFPMKKTSTEAKAKAKVERDRLIAQVTDGSG